MTVLDLQSFVCVDSAGSAESIVCTDVVVLYFEETSVPNIHPPI